MTKSSKRTAIVMALITVALCAAVIAGATFALFSSSVTNDINVNTGDISVTGTLSLESAWSESEEGAREQGSVSGDSATVPQGGSVSVNPDSGAITFNNISMGDGAEFNLALNVTNTIRAKYCVELSVTNADNGSFLQDNLQITFDDAVADLSGGTASLRGWTTLAANEGASDSVSFTISLPWTAEGADSAGSQSISLQLVTKAVQANASSGQNFETSDGSGYDTIEEAVENASDGDTVMIMQDSLTLPANLADIAAGKSIVIEGQGIGKTTVTNSSRLSVGDNVSLRNLSFSRNGITKTGKGTIENVDVNGQLFVRDSDSTEPVVVRNSQFNTVTASTNANIQVTNTTFDSYNSSISYGAKAEFTDCTFTHRSSSNPNITVSGTSSSATFTGCSFETNASGLSVFNGATATCTDCTFVNNNTDSNYSLIRAYNNSSAASGSNTSLTLNACTITDNNTDPSVATVSATSGGNIVLNGGSVTGANTVIFAYSDNRESYPYSYVTLDGGVKITTTGESANALQIGYGVNGNPATGGPAELVVEDAVIEALSANASAVYMMNDSIVKINGGTITSGTFAISTNNTTGYDAELYINGGTITSTNEVAIYLPALKTFNMTGGTVKGTAALDVRLGEVNISGGTLISTADELNVLQYVNGAVSADGVNGGSNPDGSTIILNSDIYKLNGELVDLNVTISDNATLQSATADQIHIYDWNRYGQTVTTNFASKFSYAKFELAEGSVPDKTYSYDGAEYTAYTASALAELTATAGDDAGRTINLVAGEYDLSAINDYDGNGLEISNAVTINGAGEETVLKTGGDSALARQAYIYVTADNVTISNLTITGQDNASYDLLKVSSRNTSPESDVIENFRLENVKIHGSAKTYLNLHGTKNAAVVGCTLGESGNTSQIPLSIAVSENVTVSGGSIAAGSWGSVGLMHNSANAELYPHGSSVTFADGTEIASIVYAEQISSSSSVITGLNSEDGWLSRTVEDTLVYAKEGMLPQA